MKGGPAQPSNFAAQVFDNNNGPFKGLLARSVFLDAAPGNGFDSFLASPVHVCARIENLGGFGGYVLVRCSAPRPAGNDKTESRPFDGGLNIVRRLNPLSFHWKEGGVYEVGLNANDVALIEPSLVAHNEKGEVEDVQDGALNAVFINAFKEQQQQIESQQRDEVFRPLGLISAGFGPPGTPRRLDQPRGHRARLTGGVRPVEPGPYADNPPAAGPAGTAHLSVCDLLHYAAAHAEMPRDYLPASVWAMLHASQGNRYALGWVTGNGHLWHDGSNTLWYAQIAVWPGRHRAAVIVTNDGREERWTGSVRQLLDELAR
jgi:hypothetical protein